MKPFKFIQEVRREGSKVTWPTSRETLTGSIMVVLITAFAAVFFLIIDQIFSFGLDNSFDGTSALIFLTEFIVFVLAYWRYSKREFIF